MQYVGRATAQAVSRQRLTTEAQVRDQANPCGICGGQSDVGIVFSEVFGFLLSVSFHRVSQHLYITWRMNNRLVGGSSSETQSHPIDMNNNIQYITHI
jgi:hypothetical protein